MNEKIKIKSKLKEALTSVLPIAFIVLALSFVLVPIPADSIAIFFIGTILLILGMTAFTLGAEIAMSAIGEKIGAHIAKSKNILFIIFTLFILGTIITIAEPDLKILATQISAIPSYITIGAVSIGVGIFLVIAFLRIIFKINLSYLLFIFYFLTFLITQFVPSDFWAIAFDSGGVTTGPITVPFILALGVGASSIMSTKKQENDSFGLVALCSIGPIITVLLLGMIYNINSASTENYIIANYENSIQIFSTFVETLPTYLFEVAIATLPILIFFFIFQITVFKLGKKEFTKILCGSIYTYIGLVLFLVGVNVGFLPTGYLLGSGMAELSNRWIIVPIGMLIGYFIVIAEPAVAILINQISDLTDGSIPKKAIRFNLSISMALAVGLSMIRIFFGIPIIYFLIPGYILAISLSFFTPKIFTSIAFDSGGVATGPITTTFLIPFSIGLCTSLGGNILTDAFGVVALIALMPLISVQISGIVYKLKTNKIKKHADNLKETEIIEIDWEWENCLN